ncbi:putative F-box protein [Capsicum chacoense]
MPVKVAKRKHFQTENGFSQSEQQMEKQRIPPIIQIQPYNEAKKVDLESRKKANILKCQHQGKKKLLKKKSVPHGQIRKGKRVVKKIDYDQQAIHFQEQILVDILSRLPLRSLLRFKCVSKTWEALISDPYFHKMIMKKQRQSPDSTSQKLLIRKMFSDTAPSRFKFYSSSLSTFEDVQQLDPPLTHYVDRYHIFSSFDGLALLSADTQLFLWNPLTRETALLPHTEFEAMCTCFVLGYDDATDGYKILKLDMRLPKSMEILTLKTRFWRKICNHPTAVCPTTGHEMEILPRPSKNIPMEPLVRVHGAFHWLGDLNVSGKFYVVSFSISNEVYGDVPLLEEMGKKVNYRPDFGLSLLDGMLCYYTTTNDGSLGSFKLWAMKDYGVKESWIVLCTLQFNGLVIAKPRYRFPDGELLLFSPGEFPHQCGVVSCFTFQTSKGKFGFWPERGGPFEKGIIYRESLISPKLVI